MPRRLPAFDKECFFITPIGDDGSDHRQRADGVLNAIVSPAAEALGLTAVRADRIGEGGQVNLQVIEHVCRSKLALADLTGGNLNVYYEVGMRHTTRLPLVLIADESSRDKLPFDLLTQRTIFFSNDMNGTASCKAQVQEQFERGLEAAIDSPLDAAVNIRQFEQGDAVERTLAELVTSVDGLSRQVGRSQQDRISPLAVKEAADALDRLMSIAEERDDTELVQVCRELIGPVRHMVRQTPAEEMEQARKQRERTLAGTRRRAQIRRAAAAQVAAEAAEEAEKAVEVEEAAEIAEEAAEAEKPSGVQSAPPHEPDLTDGTSEDDG